jgi:dUTP pyrophosphatase
MAKFEVVSKYADCGLALPERKTKYSAGYDLAAAKDIIIPPYENHLAALALSCNPMDINEPKDLSWISDMTKGFKAKPTLVPTGMKCKLDPGTFLQLSIRSSSPLKYWLILANGVGIIDADYYNNPDNEGHIYFQLINLSPFPIKIQKGEAIGQGIILPYGITENDDVLTERVGGFGSTTK